MFKSEYIIASAIHYDTGRIHRFQSGYGIKTGYVICGFRHPHIIAIQTINKTWLVNKEMGVIKTEQGFITSRGRYVNREEAAEIAYNSGQIETKLKRLFSEDVFPESDFPATDGDSVFGNNIEIIKFNVN